MNLQIPKHLMLQSARHGLFFLLWFLARVSEKIAW